jgi:D-sedoheptulose 7-phosphate isomerase
MRALPARRQVLSNGSTTAGSRRFPDGDVKSSARSEAVAGGIANFLDQTQHTLVQLDQRILGEIVDSLMHVWRRGRTVYVMGNGGSASTASHFAADLAKYTIIDGKPRFRVIGLTDNAPLISAWTNDGGFSSIFAEQMAAWLEPGDALVGFSVHGGSGTGGAGPWSQNMVRAMQLAKDSGAKVIGFSGFDGGAMAQMADHCLTVPVLVDEIGTPVVESVHVLLHHLVVHTLREEIRHD